MTYDVTVKGSANEELAEALAKSLRHGLPDSMSVVVREAKPVYRPLWLTDEERELVRESLQLRVGETEDADDYDTKAARDGKLTDVIGRMDSSSIPLVLDWNGMVDPNTEVQE